MEFPTAGGRVVLRDLQGHTVNVWTSPIANHRFAELAKPLPNGNLLAMLIDDTLPGPPHHKILVELDWLGNTVWSYDPLTVGRYLHHDFERLANGNTLLCTQQVVTDPTIAPGNMYDEVIMEVDPTGTVVWEWSTLANRAQLPITSAGWTYLSTRPAGAVRTLFHLNSVQSLPRNRLEDPRFLAGDVLVSYRDTNLVMVIRKSTGNVTWSMINRTIGQHHARMIPLGLPGAGNILLFDNGGASGAPLLVRDSSRIIEIWPVDGRIVWGYECVVGAAPSSWCKTTFASAFMGSVQRLPNGNTLICSAEQGRSFEVDRNRQVVWSRNTGTRIYRSYRIDANWPSSMPSFIW